MDYRKDSPQILLDFLSYHETIKAHSQRTVDEYYLDLRNFFRYMKRARNAELHELPLDQIEARAQRQLCPKNVQIFLKSMVHMIAVHPSRLSFLLCFPYLRPAKASSVCKAPAAEDIVCSLYF